MAQKEARKMKNIFATLFRRSPITTWVASWKMNQGEGGGFAVGPISLALHALLLGLLVWLYLRRRNR